MANLLVFPDLPSLTQRAAELVLQTAQEAAAARSQFNLALAGGHTPRALYRRLTEPDLADHFPWSQTHIFWGDERCVPPDHADSNYRMAYEHLLRNVPLPADHIHRMAGEDPPEQAAQRYQAELGRHFGGRPRFDLILLGMGEDGHIASLFPNTPGIDDPDRWVIVVPHDSPPPPLVTRLSLTLPVLNAARRLLVLISGVSKAPALARVAQGDLSLPAARLRPVEDDLSWLADADAAAHISSAS